MSTEDRSRTQAVVTIPAGIKFHRGTGALEVQGPLGRVSRSFPSDVIEFVGGGESVTLTLKVAANRKQAQALLHTWAAHVRNLAFGVSVGVEAKMKVVAAHFPMKVQAKDAELLIENFLGEKHPRSAVLLPGVTAQVDGDIVTLTGHDVERVGQSAANIERATKIRDYDPRVFQDGIYIIERAHLKEAN